MKFTLNRDKVVSSRYGHAVEFKKGEATHVPPEMYAEVQAIGAQPDEDLNLDADGPKGSIEPNDPLRRRAAMGLAFEALVLRNQREDFTASGAPHNAVLAKELGWNAVHAQERDEAWQEFQQEQASKKEADAKDDKHKSKGK